MTVRDLERAIDFFTYGFGMEVVHIQVQDNPYSRRLVGEPEARFRIAQLRFTDGPRPLSGHIIELICYDAPELEELSLRNPQPGAMHLAFLVPDIDPVFARVTERGAIPLSEPVAITEGINAGGRACYLKGPDGITLELLQRPAPAA
ncbi:VOC family protein [Amycolatopsis pithecellobii]|nr:VOC family protein [Amycolatopsis pithecellobii]